MKLRWLCIESFKCLAWLDVTLCGLCTVFMPWLTFSPFFCLLQFLLQLLSLHHLCSSCHTLLFFCGDICFGRCCHVAVTTVIGSRPRGCTRWKVFGWKIDRPWTYCVWPCRVKENIHACRTAALMDTHIHRHTETYIQWESCNWWCWF